MESYFHNIVAYFAEIEAEGNYSCVIRYVNHDLMLFCRLVSYFAWSASSITQFDDLFFYFFELLFILLVLLKGFKSFSTDLLSLEGKNFLNLVQKLKANFYSQLIGSASHIDESSFDDIRLSLVQSRTLTSYFWHWLCIAFLVSSNWIFILIGGVVHGLWMVLRWWILCFCILLSSFGVSMLALWRYLNSFILFIFFISMF